MSTSRRPSPDGGSFSISAAPVRNTRTVGAPELAQSCLRTRACSDSVSDDARTSTTQRPAFDADMRQLPTPEQSRHNILDLIVARAVQGAATGAATSTFSAYVSEVAPPRLKAAAATLVSIALLGGLGAGALLTGIAVEYAAAAPTLVFTTALVIFVAALAVLAFGSETVSRRPGAVASLVPRLGVGVAAARPFVALTPGLIGIWMAAGLMLGLSASITHEEFGLNGGIINGLVVAVQPLAASASAVLLAPRLPTRHLLTAGFSVVFAGLALEGAGIWAVDFPLLLAGGFLAGVGFGGAFAGTLRTLTPLTSLHERASLFSSVFLVGYLTYGVPTIAAGLLVEPLGLEGAALAYTATILAAILVALLAHLSQRQRPEPPSFQPDWAAAGSSPESAVANPQKDIKEQP